VPPGKADADAERFLSAVEAARRHDLRLEIAANRTRAAVAIGRQLVERRPESSDAVYSLAEAYRALGPRSAVPTDEERSKAGKRDAQKLSQKMTADEQERELLSRPSGQAAWKQNQARAEELYRRALHLDATNGNAHRGLGFLFEKAGKNQEAIDEYRRYLEVFVDPPDRERIERRINALETRTRPLP
jgi:Flp pilus assembly protein TadD